MNYRGILIIFITLVMVGFILLFIKMTVDYKQAITISKSVSYNIDTQLLAKIMYSECSICPLEEKLLVGSVVLNRVGDGRWGHSICEVVFCENQFYGTVGLNWTTDSLHYQLARFLMVFGPIDPNPIYFGERTDKQIINNKKLLYKQKYHIFAQ